MGLDDLPPELFQVIVEHALDSIGEDAFERFYYRFYVLRHVCRAWRSVADAWPEPWAVHGLRGAKHLGQAVTQEPCLVDRVTCLAFRAYQLKPSLRSLNVSRSSRHDVGDWQTPYDVGTSSSYLRLLKNVQHFSMTLARDKRPDQLLRADADMVYFLLDLPFLSHLTSLEFHAHITSCSAIARILSHCSRTLRSLILRKVFDDLEDLRQRCLIFDDEHGFNWISFPEQGPRLDKLEFDDLMPPLLAWILDASPPGSVDFALPDAILSQPYPLIFERARSLQIGYLEPSQGLMVESLTLQELRCDRWNFTDMDETRLFFEKTPQLRLLDLGTACLSSGTDVCRDWQANVEAVVELVAKGCLPATCRLLRVRKHLLWTEEARRRLAEACGTSIQLEWRRQ